MDWILPRLQAYNSCRIFFCLLRHRIIALGNVLRPEDLVSDPKIQVLKDDEHFIRCGDIQMGFL